MRLHAFPFETTAKIFEISTTFPCTPLSVDNDGYTGTPTLYAMVEESRGAAHVHVLSFIVGEHFVLPEGFIFVGMVVAVHEPGVRAVFARVVAG